MPARTCAEFDRRRKRKRPPYAYGTSGTGGTPHLAGELLKQRTGAQLEHIPYKGGGPAVIDVLGGQIPLVFTAVAQRAAVRANGRLIGLGVPGASARRAARRATFRERPRRLRRVARGSASSRRRRRRRPIVERLQRRSPVLQVASVQERYATLGIDPVGNTPAEFAAQMRADLARWQEVVKEAGPAGQGPFFEKWYSEDRDRSPAAAVDRAAVHAFAVERHRHVAAPVDRDQPAVAAEAAPRSSAPRAPPRRATRRDSARGAGVVSATAARMKASPQPGAETAQARLSA